MNILYKIYLLTALLLVGLASCSESEEEPTPPTPPTTPVTPGGGNGTQGDDGDKPAFDYTITEWNGETATDADEDKPGNDNSLFHEANTFSNTVVVTFNEESATIESSNNNILTVAEGAYVALNMKTNSVTPTEIILKGKTTNGGLKIYGNKAIKLTLQGVEITSQSGPAINNQCNKPLFIHLTDGTVNSLTDCNEYGNDIYYYSKTVAEDRKGCFFSEGEMIFSGTGILKVAGKYKHAITTDGFLKIRPGVTIAVTETAKNALHVKGDTEDNIGVQIDGGFLQANVSSPAGKGIKCDLKVEIKGGKQILNTTGAGEFDSSTKDTSSSAGIKSDGDCIISGGELYIKSTGNGGKGINCDANITFNGGISTIITSGGEYVYSSTYTSSPKAVKSDGNITIAGGILNIATLGASDGSEGLDCAKNLTINGGETYIYAYDDAINVETAFEMSTGKMTVYSSNNDGIDSNGALTMSGGTLVCTGAHAPESGIDVDNSEKFIIKGGTIISYAGSLQSTPSKSSSIQHSVVCNGIQGEKGKEISVSNQNNEILTFICPRTISNGTFFFSTPDVKNGTYAMTVGGDEWNTITVTNLITIVGTTPQNP